MQILCYSLAIRINMRTMVFFSRYTPRLQRTLVWCSASVCVWSLIGRWDKKCTHYLRLHTYIYGTSGTPFI